MRQHVTLTRHVHHLFVKKKIQKEKHLLLFAVFSCYKQNRSDGKRSNFDNEWQPIIHTQSGRLHLTRPFIPGM